MRLILASASPRRAEILRSAGYDFSVVPAPVDESHLPGEAAEQIVGRLALSKARAATASLKGSENALVLGADTVVVIDRDILGKPHTSQAAVSMLQKLRGREHRVMTGVALIWTNSTGRASESGKPQVAHEVTRVWFSQMSDIEIEGYVSTGEPLDKAGAYAIQGRASRFIPRIEGCYFNVVGLPIARVSRMIDEAEQTIERSLGK